MTDEIILHDEWNPLIATIANSWVRRFPMVEREDLVAELVCYWYAHPKVIRKALDEEREKERVRNISRRLNDIANGYCRKEKARSVGYQPSDEQFYTPNMLRQLLPYIFNYDYWTNPPQRDGAKRSMSLQSEGNEYLVQLCDVSFAFEMLGNEAQDLLREHFQYGVELKDIARSKCEPETTVVSRADRALRRMADVLGGSRPQATDGIGTRRVLSNAAAQAITEKQEGE